MTRVLIITGDPLAPSMAGPAIRAWNMALQLHVDNDVILLTTDRLGEVTAPFEVKQISSGDNARFRSLERWAEVIVFQGHALSQFSALRRTKKILVADIYDPMHLEMLEQGRELDAETWDVRIAHATAVMSEQLIAADFFLCASERQRSFFLGQLTTLGRVNRRTYEGDPHLSRLLAVVPFGLEEGAPTHVRPTIRGVIPGISADDKLLIWGGGLYSWFDPLTLIRAMANLAERRPTARLYFLGTRHPKVETMGIVREAHDLAETLGVLDSVVYFNQEWVEYDDRQSYLAEADAGVSTHLSHVETTFSFRTRILDYLWADLPMVLTEGDSFAELAAVEGLGIVVPARDVLALTDALEAILYDDDVAASAVANIRRVKERFFWKKTMAPLVDFVARPTHAGDYDGRRRVSVRASFRRSRGLVSSAMLVFRGVRQSGIRVTARKVRARLAHRSL